MKAVAMLFENFDVLHFADLLATFLVTAVAVGFLYVRPLSLTCEPE